MLQSLEPHVEGKPFGPPYSITEKHVQDVYQSKVLRDIILDKFKLTLRLDLRYEVITYVIASQLLGEEDRGAIVEGFSIEWLRDQALKWYRQGFRESDSEDLFQAVLDEMVELGVLRRVEPRGYYTLRSPNIATLLGTEEEINKQLLRDRKPEPQYEPATFRTAYRIGDGEEVAPARRNPLSALQESELRRPANAISLIVGCEATGLSELVPFLKMGPGERLLIQAQADSLEAFRSRLASLGDERPKDNGALSSATTLVLVPHASDWDGAWLKAAREKLDGLRSRSSFVHFAFVADPAKASELV